MQNYNVGSQNCFQL